MNPHINTWQLFNTLRLKLICGCIINKIDDVLIKIVANVVVYNFSCKHDFQNVWSDQTLFRMMADINICFSQC